MSSSSDNFKNKFQNKEAGTENICSKEKGVFSRAISYGRSLVKGKIAHAAAPIAIIGAVGTGSAALSNTGCAPIDDLDNMENVGGGNSENVGTVQQAISYSFGPAEKLAVQINDEASNQYSPSVIEDGPNWVLYYVSDHAGGIKAMDPYRGVIDKNRNVITPPAVVPDANNDFDDLDFKICLNKAYVLSTRGAVNSVKAWIHDTGGQPVPTTVTDEGEVPGGINDNVKSTMGVACDASNNQLIITTDLNTSYDRPFISTIGTWSWSALTTCEEGNLNIRGVNVYNGNLIYDLDGDDIKIRPFDGTNCTGASELIDGASNVVNAVGKKQITPFMAPGGEGLFYAQEDSPGNFNLYFAPLTVCGDSVQEGTEQCDDGPGNGTPCTPPYGNSCNYCDNSCNIVNVPMAEWCDDTTVNGPEQCDDGPVLNGQVCVPPYGNSCNYCDDSCVTQNVPMQEWCDDNTINGPEQCDDGPVLNGQVCVPPYGNSCNYCDNSCVTQNVPIQEWCDDNIVNGPEQCDDGPVLNGQVCVPPYNSTCNYCDNSCVTQTVPIQEWCDDNIINGPEQCDDGPVQNGQVCVPPYGNSCNYCDNSCVTQTVPMQEWCDDNIINGPEQCDNGAVLNGQVCVPPYGNSCNYCDDSCVTQTVPMQEFCGDTIKNGPEQCDNGVNNTDTPCTSAYNDTCTYCDTSCVEHTEQGAYCGDGNCDNGNEDQNNCTDDCGSGPGCNMEVTQGSCNLSCDEAGAITVTFPPGATCRVDHVSEDCYFEATRDARDPNDTVHVSTGGVIDFPVHFPYFKMGQGTDKCFTSTHSQGMSASLYGTSHDRIADPGLNDPANLPHVFTYTTLEDYIGLAYEGMPIDVTPNADPYTEGCENGGPCQDPELPEGKSFTYDIDNPIDPGFPDGGTDTVAPKDDGGCNCKISTQSPRDLSSDVNKLIGLVMLGGLSVYRRRRREEQNG